MKAALLFVSLVTTVGVAQACCNNWQQFQAMCNAQGMDAVPGTNNSYLACVPRVDPRIAQAYRLNELGRAAYMNKNYDAAAQYFEEANAVYPDDVYRGNRTLALAGKYFAQGIESMSRRAWRQAIDRFQQVLALQTNEAAAENIRSCEASIADDAGNAAWRRQDWDAAIAAFQEEKRWNLGADVEDAIRRANEYKHFDLGQAAFAQENYAVAFNEYSASLRFNPGDTAAITNAGLCEERQAKRAVQSGDLVGAISHFEQEFGFLQNQAGAAQNPQDVRTFLSRTRRFARSALSNAASTDHDWNLIIQAHERWSQESNNDPTAQDELTTVSAMRINRSVGSVKSVESAQAMAGRYDALLQQNPSNRQAAWGHEQATKVLKRAVLSRQYVEMDTQHNERAIRALNQARAAIQHPEACFQGAGGLCDERASGTDPKIPTPSGMTVISPGMYLPEQSETPELKALHQDIIEKQAANERELADYKKEPDVLKRREIKPMLEIHAAELKDAQEKYAEKATTLVSHSIKPKHSVSK